VNGIPGNRVVGTGFRGPQTSHHPTTPNRRDLVDICLIPPKSMLNYAEDEQYHLCLSDEILSDPQGLYAKFYRRQSEMGRYVILDNMAHETGCGNNVERLIHAIDIIQPAEVVLPDRLFFGEDTVALSTKALGRLTDHYPLGLHYMGVPQGRTFNEWFECLRGLAQLGVTTIGISKDYEVWHGGLVALAEMILNEYTYMTIHFLGWGRDLQQLSSLGALSTVYPKCLRSVDSAKPFVYAHAGVAIPRDLAKVPTYPRRPHDYFAVTAINGAILDHNIEVFREAAKGNL
jgi:hypothetical protein